MNEFTYYMPVRVQFGEDGVRKHLKDEIMNLGNRIMIVYGGGSVKKNGILDQVTEVLSECGKETVLFGGAPSNPTYKMIREGIAFAKKEKADFLLAVGGGSVIDSTKIMAAGMETDEDIWEEEIVRNHVPEKMGKYGVVLTISGAGSEMDNLGACTYEERHEKKTLQGPYASFVIEDPHYLMTVPLHTFTPGVFDSLSHCMESYFGKGFNVWDEMNESLMRNIIHNGKALMITPDSMEIRSNLMWDSSLIQSFSFYQGHPGDFQVHGIENMLAAYTHGTHGRQLAILQPVYYEHIFRDEPEKFARFAVEVMGVDPTGLDLEEIAAAGVRALREFVHTLQLPSTFSEAGIEVTEEIARKTADTCAVSETNARILTRQEIFEIIMECM